MALPRDASWKSCTRTVSGWPLGRQVRPAFLKSPTSSFFFVSTEIAGCPRIWNRRTNVLMYSNCAFRSRGVILRQRRIERTPRYDSKRGNYQVRLRGRSHDGRVTRLVLGLRIEVP